MRIPEQAGPADAAVRLGAEDTSTDSAFLTDLLLYVLEFGCSDLHLTAGAHPHRPQLRSAAAARRVSRSCSR
jgi:hypothetical protein